MTVTLSHVRSGHSPGLKADIPRRPSPWHEIAHSLSETALPTRRCSISSHVLPTGATAEPRNTPPLSKTTQPTPPSDPIALVDASPSPNLSSSALREWDRLLSSSSDVKRHQLVHPSSSPHLRHANSTSSLGSKHAQHHSPGPPKLAAERDKDGHIEYKLKLIDPTPERFDKLVTQMLWRLKQGRNEAIYELGLADDGTVVGLTRLEMDASLRTLELMASEVGATVIVLREVVLVGGPSYPSHRFTPALSPSISSSAPSASDLSISSDAPIAEHVDKVWAWPVTRPDLDKEGLPRVSTMGGKKWRGRARRERRAVERERQRAAWRAGQPGCKKPSDSDADVDVPPFHLDLDDAPKSPVAPPIPHVNSTPSWRAWQHERKGRRRKGQHIHPEAQLDEGDPMAALPFSHFLPHGAGRQVQGQGQGEPSSKKQSAKAVKAAARREQRRLDLYRGDGTGELWLNMENAGVGANHELADEDGQGTGRDKSSGPDVNGEGPTSSIPRAKDDGGPMKSTGGNGADYITNGTGTPPACVPMLHPYQPARPSSLRLATPAPSLTRPSSMSDPAALDQVEEEIADPVNDPFLAELLLLPLDNLSLSFAEVRTVTDPYAAYSDDDHSHDGSEGEDHGEETTTYAPSPTLSVADGASPLGAADVGTGMGTGTGQGVNGPEMICVEALVVRKTAEGVAGVEDWCEGGEDAWGFGYGYGDGGGDGDGEVEADVEAEEQEGKAMVQQQQGEVDDDDPWGF